MLDRASLWLQWFPAKSHNPNCPHDSSRYSAQSEVLALKLIYLFLWFVFWQMLHDFWFLHLWKSPGYASLTWNVGALEDCRNSQGLVEFSSAVTTVTSQIPGGTAILSRNFSQGSNTDTYLDRANEARTKQGEGWRRGARKKKELTSLGARIKPIY